MKMLTVLLAVLLIATVAFSGPTKTTGYNLSILTTPVTDFRGDVHDPFGVSVLPDGRIAVNVTLINTGESNWESGDYVLHPEWYQHPAEGNYLLTGLIRVEVTTLGNQQLMATEPALYDVGDNFPLDDPMVYPYTELSGPVPFVLSAHWANPLTENNTTVTGEQAGMIVLPTGTPAGTYRVNVTLDPYNRYGAAATWTATFSTTGAAITSESVLKATKAAKLKK